MGGTVRKVVVGVGGLIGLYLVVAYATGSGKVIDSGARGSATVIKSLQGR